MRTDSHLHEIDIFPFSSFSSPSLSPYCMELMMNADIIQCHAIPLANLLACCRVFDVGTGHPPAHPLAGAIKYVHTTEVPDAHTSLPLRAQTEFAPPCACRTEQPCQRLTCAEPTQPVHDSCSIPSLWTLFLCIKIYMYIASCTRDPCY